jgi:hypothetical protein
MAQNNERINMATATSQFLNGKQYGYKEGFKDGFIAGREAGLAEAANMKKGRHKSDDDSDGGNVTHLPSPPRARV